MAKPITRLRRLAAIDALVPNGLCLGWQVHRVPMRKFTELSCANQPSEEFSPEETARRMEDAIRRALNTPSKPNSEYVGKSERAKAHKRSRAKKSKV